MWDWDAARAHCYAVARTVLRSDADAEDAAQEAVMRGWRLRASCREPGHQLAWLGRIAYREALRIYGQRRETVELDDVAAPAPNVLEGSFRRLALEPFLAELPPQDRLLLLLRFGEDLTYRELARRLDMPLGTAKVRLHRLQARLRARLIDAEWPPGE